MATDRGIAKISELFNSAYDKPIPAASVDLWRKIFSEVSDADLVKAAFYLVERREKGIRVTPGEVTWGLEAIGKPIQRYKPSTMFTNDPIVRALNARSQATEQMEGITQHEWLKREGLTFREAAAKYADCNESIVPAREMAYAAAIASKEKRDPTQAKPLMQQIAFGLTEQEPPDRIQPETGTALIESLNSLEGRNNG